MENNDSTLGDWENDCTDVSYPSSYTAQWMEEMMGNGVEPPFPDQSDPYLANTEDELSGYVQRELSNNTRADLHDAPRIRQEDDTTRSSEKANEDCNLKQPEQKVSPITYFTIILLSSFTSIIFIKVLLTIVFLLKK